MIGDKTSIVEVLLQYRVEKRETEKIYNEFRGLCTRMRILIYNEKEMKG